LDRQVLIEVLTGTLARLISKGLMIYGGIETVRATTAGVQIATAAVTLAVLVLEQWQSHLAHQCTAAKAVAAKDYVATRRGKESIKQGPFKRGLNSQ
jgi:hypothetical protein